MGHWASQEGCGGPALSSHLALPELEGGDATQSPVAAKRPRAMGADWAKECPITMASGGGAETFRMELPQGQSAHLKMSGRATW